MAGATVYIEGNTHILENESAKDGGGIGVSKTGTNKLYINDGHIYANTAVNGGGVYNGKELYFSAGGISQNIATAFGGGVYNVGSMFMYGSAVIGDSTKTTAATDTTETGCSNKAEYGAGIYSLGNLYLGYSDADTETDLTGGVFYNFSHDTGGIYQYANKTFLMNSGFVSYNAGRGIYVGNCSLTMSGGSVIGNTTFEPGNDYQTNGAGIYAGVASTVLISGGTISGNEAGEDGGGLYIAKPETSVTISGGTISSNSADGNGNGIAIADGYLKVKDGAKVDSSNDVYLASEKIITITDSLSGSDAGNVISITPNTYAEGRQLLEAEDGVTLADEVGKFKVTPEVANPETPWRINAQGKLTLAPLGFVSVASAEINGNETWTPSSRLFVTGRSLTIGDLYASDHEVTRGEFKALMGEDPSTASACDKEGNTLTGEAVLNNPVSYVTWYAAITYCNKLSIKEGLTPAYTVSGIDWENLAYSAIPTSSDSTWNAVTCDFEADGYRLPTDAEWEWLARGGEDYDYAGSNTLDDVAWYSGNTNDNTGTRPVKTKAANGYGLYDMSGNVYEWCWDWYESISASTGMAGPASGTGRVYRGGSYHSGLLSCAVSREQGCPPPQETDFYIGFRVVRNAQ